MQLSIPAIAFIVTKIMKVFEAKLEGGKRRQLNESHSGPWVAEVTKIYNHLKDRGTSKPYQVLDPSFTFSQLTDNEEEKLELLRNGTQHQQIYSGILVIKLRPMVQWMPLQITMTATD